MITISLLGLDQYVAGHYSKTHTENLAQLFEVDEDAVSFYAPNSIIIHNGVEQTSWNTEVRVHLPTKFAPLEEKVADYLIQTLKEITINTNITFEYYEEASHYEYQNDEYPKFIRADNIVDMDDPYAEENEEEYDGPTPEPYLGNIFAGKEEELDAKYSADEEYLTEEDK